MFADLISGSLAGKAFKFNQTDVLTAERKVNAVEAGASQRLREVVEAAAAKL